MNDDKVYLQLAYRVASCSLDKDTQNGAVIVSPFSCSDKGDYTSASTNGIPHKLDNEPDRWQRPEKYDWIVHAEHGALLQAARKGLVTEQATMYCPWFSCEHCALSIVQAGIARVVGHSYYYAAANPKWDSKTERGIAILEEAGVALDWVEEPIIEVPWLRVNGVVFDPAGRGEM